MIKQKTGILRIGTSGIVVPGSKETFPQEFAEKSRLNYYASLFNTLEVNSTFKKIPRTSTLEKWSQEVPEQFRFTIKVWKEVTHVKQLNIDFEHLGKFISTIEHIGSKKGCLLIQFPASITFEYYKQVDQILERLHELDKKNQWQKAVEFRSLTWYMKETDELLHQYNSTLVLHDMPKSKKLDASTNSQIIYYRLHGPLGDYRGSYTDDFLQEQATKIAILLDKGKDVYVYFNNTTGNAFENAMRLKAMVEGS